MDLHGKNFIGGELSGLGRNTLFGFDPRKGEKLKQSFFEATEQEIDRSVELAEQAFPQLRAAGVEVIAGLLEMIAEEIVNLGAPLIDQASQESGLTADRLIGERGRTVNQLRLFADLVKEGSFVDARIDTALPDRKPLPRPDLRRMLIPIGPVAVFGASNFPLAFSVAGGDTASALAARNPVIFKAHPAHPGTSELVAGAIAKAVKRAGLPGGTFSLLHSTDPAVSIRLVQHPSVKAVAFTGSERAGRAIFDAAAQRAEPIPAYVEMGSINPVFILPGALASSPDTLAQGLFNSVNLGVGQFCTSPGVVIGRQDDVFGAFAAKLAGLFKTGVPGTMLYPGILKGYEQAVAHRAGTEGVHTVPSGEKADGASTEARPVLFDTTSSVWLQHPHLAAEVFGPSSVVVRCSSDNELMRVAESLPGSLTVTIWGTPDDIKANSELIHVLEIKAGRLLFNGFPTGVEVSPAMHHGGPYPATADPKFTSVGTAAILRFVRPVCYQNFPEETLPLELRNGNPRHIWRTVNGQLTREALG
jgi:alpha-ketoglutaric semialdehyde dehydrogenase